MSGLSNGRYIYCLDSVPIFVATVIFAIPGFFPGRLLTMETHDQRSFNIELSEDVERDLPERNKDSHL